MEFAIRPETLIPKQRVLETRLLGTEGIQPSGWEPKRPAVRLHAVEEARKLDHVRIPGWLAEGRGPHAEVRKAAATEFARRIQTSRHIKYRPSSAIADSTGFQRVRAAAYIQIREPEFREPNPGDRFDVSARMAWRVAPMQREARPVYTPVLLRPAVRTPELAA
jgi:hypothetical protein